MDWTTFTKFKWSKQVQLYTKHIPELFVICSIFRFLRGGLETDVLNVEEDSLQEHTHAHTINDPGHTHQYGDIYFDHWDNVNGEAWLAFGDNDDLRRDHLRTNYLSMSGISISVNEVNGARTSTETRPKNMRVVYIMKVC